MQLAKPEAVIRAEPRSGAEAPHATMHSLGTGRSQVVPKASPLLHEPHVAAVSLLTGSSCLTPSTLTLAVCFS
jgi:hypothetical protein